MIDRGCLLRIFLSITCLCSILMVSNAFGEDTNRTSGDIFGKESGYFHPFISLSESYNDNIYNTKDKEEDFITVISPGLWLALPGTKESISVKEVSGNIPGGLNNTRFKSETFIRYQAYALYSPQFEIFSKNDDENSTSHLAEGGLQYNLKGGLSFDIIDQYLKSHDSRGEGVSTSLDEYENNLVDGMISYELSPKIMLRAGGATYNVHYTENRNSYKDRQDMGLSGYLFYAIMSKTSIYAGYDHIDVDYDDDTSANLSDSNLNRYFTGVKWDITAKSKGNIKVGYLTREFDKDTENDFDGIMTEVAFDHNFTSSTGISCRGAKSNQESDIAGSSYIDSTMLGLGYNQKITTKIMASLELRWENLDYNNISRTDDIYMISPKLQYKFTDWLTSDLVYSYKTRDAESDTTTNYDYENNTYMVKVTAAI